MSVQSVLFVHLAFLYGPSPHALGSLCGTVAPAPTRRRSALHPSDFLPDEKVTKESPRGVSPLGTPLGGHYHPPSGFAAPPRKGCNSGQHPETKSNCRATD